MRDSLKRLAYLWNDREVVLWMAYHLRICPNCSIANADYCGVHSRLVSMYYRELEQHA